MTTIHAESTSYTETGIFLLASDPPRAAPADTQQFQVQLLVCDRCGATVIDADGTKLDNFDVHDLWHAELDRDA